MKKFGFTLAETLIALSIVGITAALTIPTLVNSNNKKIYATSLASAVSDFETAMTTLIIDENVDNLLYTEAWQGIKNSSNNQYSLSAPTQSEGEDEKKDNPIPLFMANAFKLIKMEGYSVSAVTYPKWSKPSGERAITSGNAVRFKCKNGAEYMVLVNGVSESAEEDEKTILKRGGNYLNKAADVYIDVNGTRKPNVASRDFFKFELGTDGRLYPYGGKDWAAYHNSTDVSPRTKCIDDQDDDYCAAYLVNNKYKMDY